MQRFLFITAISVLAFALGCSEPTGPRIGAPANVTRLGADNLQSAVGTTLSDSLVVRVTDAGGRPVSGVAVAWAAAEGSGSVSPASSTTNAAGEARTAWTLGTTAGEHTATATISELSPVSFTATAAAGAPANLTKLGTDDQEARAGSSLPDSIGVRVTDTYGNPVSGAEVSWAVSAGGGSVSPASTTTNTAGEARAAWTLGSTASEHSASASVIGLPAVSFTATATAGAPAQLHKVSETPESEVAGSTLSEPLVVRVTDEHENPVSGATVTWAVTAGSGSVSPASTTANAAGEASTTWTLGTTAGENRISATIEGVPPQTFVTNATPGAPAEMTKLSGDGQEALTGSTLSDSLAVRVVDRYGNAVGGAAVSWEVAKGDGRVSPATTTTRADGVAKTSWQLGDSVGSQTVVGRVGTTTVTANFNATADARDPERAEPVQLVPGTTVGQETFPVGNTDAGGQGQTISGVSCMSGQLAYHIHSHVSLFAEGVQIAIPAGAGIVNPVMQDGVALGGSCLYWIHTHDATGIIHVEPSVDTELTLGQFFDVWGQPLTDDNIAGFRGPVTVYVDGVRYRGDPREITFTDRKQITLYVGTRLAPLPTYIFPGGL